METLNSLKNHLLIAMPSLEGDFFGGSITYLCEHNAEGAMGLVLNKPSDFSFAEICDQLNIARREHITPLIMTGGPVGPDQGFVLHQESGNWGATMHIDESAHLTSSRDILQAIAQGTGPQNYVLGLGYAGWSAGQLDQELRDNSWLTLEATPDLLFNLDHRDVYQVALSKLGVSAEFLSSEAGHA
ncbi:MAG: YqgE/AlgH family protein [Pseudomonadota bacterium]|nr:YqgE/AlgH family protein [Pseudomonadota bacterium]